MSENSSSENITKPFKSFELLGTIGSILTIVQALIFSFIFLSGNNDFLDGEGQFRWGFIVTIISLTILNVILVFSLVRVYIKNYKLFRNQTLKEQEITNLKNSLLRTKEGMVHFATTFHNIAHELRNMQNDVLSALYFDDATAHFLIRENMKSFLGFFCSNIRDSFTKFLDNECSVYILIISDENNGDDVKVETFWRDHRSYVTRQKFDRAEPTYSVSKFKPLDYILSDKNTESLYICNDCINDRYFRDRIDDDWNELYNAILVSPIRRQFSSETGDYLTNTIGFLVVDNMKGGFDNTVCKDAIRTFTDLIYNFFIMIDVLDEKEEEIDIELKEKGV